jgi:hypothetical protein
MCRKVLLAREQAELHGAGFAAAPGADRLSESLPAPY